MRYALLPLLLSLCSVTTATDWLTLPSTYSHDATGARVSQYAPIVPPTAPGVANFRTSGYTQTRSSLNYGPSADNYHRVQEWGRPVRPYGEWQFPFRPYSTPYPNWGPPFAGFNLGFGFPGYGSGFGGYYPDSGYGGHPPHGDGKPGEGEVPKHRHRPRHPADYERGFLGGGRWPIDRSRRDPRLQQNPLYPFPAGPGTPYPFAPY